MGKLMYKGVPYSATGEVKANPQGTPSDVLDSIKINGTVYGIEGGAGVFIGNVPTNYSTEEKVIGTWIDGKPLYQKTYYLSSPLTIRQDTWVQIQGISIADIDRGVSTICANERGQFDCVISDLKTSPIELWNTRSANISIDSITCQYTKTTDTAYTVPVGDANYYSTSEQIVGRWIDGKPLYQKTIQNNSGITNLNTWEEIADVGVTCDIKRVEGYIITSVGDIPFNYSGDGANISYIMNSNASDTSVVKTLGKVIAILNSGSNWLRNLPIVATLQYTKTTD